MEDGPGFRCASANGSAVTAPLLVGCEQSCHPRASVRGTGSRVPGTHGRRTQGGAQTRTGGPPCPSLHSVRWEGLCQEIHFSRRELVQTQP